MPVSVEFHYSRAECPACGHAFDAFVLLRDVAKNFFYNDGKCVACGSPGVVWTAVVETVPTTGEFPDHVPTPAQPHVPRVRALAAPRVKRLVGVPRVKRLAGPPG